VEDALELGFAEDGVTGVVGMDLLFISCFSFSSLKTCALSRSTYDEDC
jgi:hypothetical protein